MPTALIASLSLLPPLATTGVVQDVWLWRAHERWQDASPASYWGYSLLAWAVALIVWRKARRPLPSA